MLDRFHLSFRVRDLDRSRDFYTRVLGCPVGREQATWFDLDFFGHQVTLHEQPADARTRGRAQQALDHFGLHVEQETWAALSKRLESARAEFRVKPTVRFAGEEHEQGKFVVVDPDGFGLEFKYGSPAPKGPKTRLLYIELKSDANDRGPAWIGHGVLSKSGRTVYFNGRALKRAAGGGVAGNHVCAETGEEYWISAPKQDGTDRHWAGGGPVQVERAALQEYLELRGLAELDPVQYEIIDALRPTDRSEFHQRENTPSKRPVRAPVDESSGERVKEWLVMIAARCLVEGTPAGSLDVTVHYALARSERDARAQFPLGEREAYENPDGKEVRWERVEILAVEEFGEVRSGDEVAGFISELDELGELAR